MNEWRGDGYFLPLWRRLTNAMGVDTEEGKPKTMGKRIWFELNGDRLDRRFSTRSFVDRGENYGMGEEGRCGDDVQSWQKFWCTANDTGIALASYQDLQGMIPVLAVSPDYCLLLFYRPQRLTLGNRQRVSRKANSSCMHVDFEVPSAIFSQLETYTFYWCRRLQVPRLSR